MSKPFEIASSDELGTAICEALGIDEHKTGRMIIDLQPGQPALIYFVQVIPDSALTGFPWGELIKRSVRTAPPERGRNEQDTR